MVKDGDWYGEEVKTFEVTDREGLSTEKSYIIVFEPVNDPPVVTSISVSEKLQSAVRLCVFGSC